MSGARPTAVCISAAVARTASSFFLRYSLTGTCGGGSSSASGMRHMSGSGRPLSQSSARCSRDSSSSAAVGDGAERPSRRAERATAVGAARRALLLLRRMLLLAHVLALLLLVLLLMVRLLLMQRSRADDDAAAPPPQTTLRARRACCARPPVAKPIAGRASIVIVAEARCLYFRPCVWPFRLPWRRLAVPRLRS